MSWCGRYLELWPHYNHNFFFAIYLLKWTGVLTPAGTLIFMLDLSDINNNKKGGTSHMGGKSALLLKFKASPVSKLNNFFFRKSWDVNNGNIFVGASSANSDIIIKETDSKNIKKIQVWNWNKFFYFTIAS